jgi:hypothetical protein
LSAACLHLEKLPLLVNWQSGLVLLYLIATQRPISSSKPRIWQRGLIQMTETLDLTAEEITYSQEVMEEINELTAANLYPMG